MTGHRKWILLPLLLFYFHGKAQNFVWKSSLDTVQQSGFYSIPLSIDWLVRLKTDLSDIRIIDEKNKAVPFLVRQNPSERNSSFINFPVLKNSTDSLSTTIELDAANQHGTDHLCLILGNHAVERFASLSGSDDRTRWFIIEEKIALTNRPSLVDDHFAQWLSFPFIRYRYLKLVINNRGTDPLHLLNAGVFKDTSLKEYLSLYLEPSTVFQQKDSTDGRTYISVHNPQPYPVDRISLKLSGARFYKRPLSIYRFENGKTKELVASTEIRSDKDPAIWFMGGKTQNFLIVIENGDNPPLDVTSVNTQCRRQELVTYLEKGNRYTLVGGNDSAGFPNYDLFFFRDSIPTQTTVLEHKNVVPNNQQYISSSHNKNWWIWPAVIAMVIVLALLTFRLLGDIKKDKT